MLNALLTRWARTRGALSTTFFARSTQTAQAKGDSSSFWQTILRRHGEANGAAGATDTVVDRLPPARAAFTEALAGLNGEQVEELAKCIGRSRQLEDLWNLRTWLYNEIARQFSQYEAEHRLAQLQTHFSAAGGRH